MTKRRVAVRGIIFKNGRMFCQKLKHKETGKINPFWSTPGGGLDPGESLVRGLEREMIEETGVKPEVGALLFIQQFQIEDTDHLEFFFHIKNADDYEQIILEQTSHGLDEIDDMGFVDPHEGNILPDFLEKEDLAGAIQRGTTQIFTYLTD